MRELIVRPEPALPEPRVIHAPPPPVAEARFATARDLVYVLFKYRVRILSVFLATALTVYAIISVVPEKWDATSSVLVQLGRENAAVPVTVVKEAFVQGGVTQERVNSEIAALRAPALIAETADALGVDRFFAGPPTPRTLRGWVRWAVRGAYRGVRTLGDEVLYALNLQTRLGRRDAVIAGLTQGLTASAVQGSQVLDVTLRLPDPNLAAEAVNTLLARHLVRRAGYFREAGAASLYEEAVAAREAEVKRADEQLAAFRAISGISVLNEQREAALAQRRALEETRHETEATVTRLRAEIGALREQLAKLPSGIKAEETTRNPVGQSLAERLAGLQQRRARLIGNFRPDSRFVQEIEREIAEIEGQMKGQRSGDYGSTTVGVNPSRQTVELRILQLAAELTGREAELATHAEQQERIQATLDRYDQLEGQARELDRGRTLAEEALLTYRKKAEETRISDEMSNRHLTNLVVLSPATPPAQPSRPRKMLLMAVGLVGGLLAGVAAAFGADAVDRSVRYGGDLVQLGIPVLVTVPRIESGFRPSPLLFIHGAV